LYARLRPGAEPDVIHAAAGEGATILELGCGAGRVTHPLIALGHAVTAVDESPDMLEHVQGAETVLSKIEDLDLGDRRFGAVVLASHLINEPSGELAAAWLRVCRRYVADDGSVIAEQHSPAWFDTAADTESERDGITFRLRDVTRPEPGLLHAAVEYQAGDLLWTQTFGTRRLDDEALRDLLAAAGLTLDHYLTDDKAWVRAVSRLPVSRHPGWRLSGMAAVVARGLRSCQGEVSRTPGYRARSDARFPDVDAAQNGGPSRVLWR
jgi:SAM-dependent methyltransferase